MVRIHQNHRLRLRWARATTLIALAILVSDQPASAQCEKWHQIAGGLDGPVNTLTIWNDSLIVGGQFSAVNAPPNLTLNHLARRDAAGWHQFVSSAGIIGVSGIGSVYGLTEWNGDLVAAGSFTAAGGQTVNNIARWDGADWHPFMSPGGQIGTNATVRAVTVWNGSVLVGGAFTIAGGQAATHIARWDGNAWSSLTSGGQNGVSLNGAVYSLTVWNNNLIAGGTFATAGGEPVNNIARWDGTAWHPLTSDGQIGVSGPTPVTVFALCNWNGNLIAGGTFTTAGGQIVNRIALWDGIAWQPLSTGMNNTVFTLTTWNGDLLAGGAFTMAGDQPSDNRVAIWNGALWSPLASGLQSNWTHTDAVTVWNGRPIAAPGGSTQPTTLQRWACDGDVNFDGLVDVDDLLAIINAWGPCSPKELCEADIAPPLSNGDGQVNVDDLLLVINNWG